MKVTDVSGSALVVERGTIPLAFIADTEVQFYMGPEAVTDMIEESALTSSLNIESSDASVTVSSIGPNQFNLSVAVAALSSTDGSITITAGEAGAFDLATTKSAIGCCSS
jgi:hypothetical protein